jgi:hypothetical protein
VNVTVVKVIAVLTLGLFTMPLVAAAQQAGKVYQIGYLSAGIRAGGPSFQLFEQVSVSVAG